MAQHSSACPSTPTERVIRGIVAVVVAAVAVSTPGWMALPFALFAAVLAIGALTGKCPNQYFTGKRTVQTNSMGYPDAVDIVNLHL